jgi:ribosomal protein S8E
MLPDEIQQYFQEHGNVCGRFNNSQLDSLTIQIPNRILYSQTHYHKMFLLALFVAMGTTLFSCADKNGNKQKIDKIEVVEDTIKASHISMGMKMPPLQKSIDSLHFNTTPPPRIDQVKYTKTKKHLSQKAIQNKVTIIGVTANNRTIEIEEDYSVYGLAGISQHPEYIGGILNFQQDIQKQFQFSKKAKHINGILAASFLVEKDGNLDSINISKDIGFGTKEELIRVLSKTKKWLPAEVNGKKRNCKFQLSITIKSDTIKKSFFRTKVIPKIDTIEITRITKFEND